MGERVVVLGASNNETRYANKAMALLMENGHEVVPVTPKETEVLGQPAVATVNEVSRPVDTVTVYVRPAIFRQALDAVVALQPKRVIFNPGTEDAALMETLRTAGIKVVEACTIVMQKTGQY